MIATGTVDDRDDDTRRATAGPTSTTLVREQDYSRTYDHERALDRKLVRTVSQSMEIRRD